MAGKAKDEELEKLKSELEELVGKIKASQKSVADKTMKEVCGDITESKTILCKCKKVLRGHLNKVNSVHFSGDNRHVVSGALDSKLIIWDTWTGNKTQIIPLLSSWTMAVAFSPSGNLVACGGMDNMCTIYDVNNRDPNGAAKIKRELVGYEGFLSSCRFIDDGKILTGSADMKIIVWDLEKNMKQMEFYGHSGDVMTLSLHSDLNTFVTGSVDKTAKLWDLREGQCKQTFWGHDADVNSVCLHKNGTAFATGSEDKTARLFDIRADQEIAQYTPPSPNSGFTSCALSNSGRLLICGSDDGRVHFWDVLTLQHIGTLPGHENRITSLSMPDNGMAIATGSWDTNVRVWN